MRERPDGMLEAESFEEHMTPQVTWVEDPAFAQAFASELGISTRGTDPGDTLPADDMCHFDAGLG